MDRHDKQYVIRQVATNEKYKPPLIWEEGIQTMFKITWSL